MFKGGTICFAFGIAACATVPPEPRVFSPTEKKAPPLPAEPISFLLYCDPGQVKFNDKYWDEVFRAKDEVLKRKDFCIRIHGYASLDRQGDIDKRTAQERANWVRTSLKSEGVDETFIKETVGMDPVPLSANAPEGERTKSRRVEIILEPCINPRDVIEPGVVRDPNDPFRYQRK